MLKWNKALRGGRGFAVVATEIGELAGNSQSAVSEIQAVSAEVISAVNELATEAQELLSFVNSTTLEGFTISPCIAKLTPAVLARFRSTASSRRHPLIPTRSCRSRP